MPGRDLRRQRRPRRSGFHRRPPPLLSARDPVTIGIDVGGSKVLGVAVDGSGGVQAERRAATPEGSEALVSALLGMVTELSRYREDVSAVGVGLPGLVDGEGKLRFAPHLPAVTDLDVGHLLAAETGMGVHVDNDANCALAAEHAGGAARGTANCLLVTLGTGIGGGLLVDGRLARGRSGFGGEVGHMVVEAEGSACACGQLGCWERYASGAALGRRGAAEVAAGRGRRLLALAGGDAAALSGRHVTAAAAEGDAEAVAILGRFASWVAVGLANLVHVLDPERIVIGGGLAAAGDILLDPVRSALPGRLLAGASRPPVPIMAAALGPRAGAVGAALLAGNRGAAEPPAG